MNKIEHGKIRPSKSLQDTIASMLTGNREFVMIDEQKRVYEEILNASRLCQSDGKKRTVIVEGGPGTGKTVHRLGMKSGMYKNMGENQIKEIIHAACCSVFFIDESQRVTMDDAGSWIHPGKYMT